MILALNASVELAFVMLAEQGAAMAADIVEGADVALFVARDDDAGIGELGGESNRRHWESGSVRPAHSHMSKVDGFHLTLKPGRVSVVALRQRHGFTGGDCRTGVGIGGHQRHQRNQ